MAPTQWSFLVSPPSTQISGLPICGLACGLTEDLYMYMGTLLRYVHPFSPIKSFQVNIRGVLRHFHFEVTVLGANTYYNP